MLLLIQQILEIEINGDLFLQVINSLISSNY